MARKRKNIKKKNDNILTKIFIALIVFVFLVSTIIFKSSMGFIGEYLSKGIFILFGLTAYIYPIFAIFLFFALLNKDFIEKNKKKIFIGFLLLINLSILLASFYIKVDTFSNVVNDSFNQAIMYTGGGVIFSSIYFLINKLIADIGLYILSIVIVFVSYFYFFDKSIIEFFKNFSKLFQSFISNIFSKKNHTNNGNNKVDKKNKKINTKTDLTIDKNESKSIYDIETNNEKLEPKISYYNNFNDVKSTNIGIDFNQIGIVYDDNYQYSKPPLDLLNDIDESSGDDESLLLKNANTIVETLNSFGISSEIVNINNGPTVTSYEVKPQSGIKVSKIVNLSNNLSMALASPGIRIEAPIPGKPYVGIEVPNINKDIVTFKSLVSTEEFIKEDDDIKVAIGKDLFGNPIYANINAMPHLLIAGATGSGKSVLMNIIIMSIIYKYSPSEVEFIMIDPKMVELKIYSEIPHLKGRKVVTKATEATASLHEAVKEMTSRFETFSKNGCRDIKAYNAKVEEDDNDLEKMPYLVVIIDELSDLMMEASKDVEHYITRLAQMGRASGVHLIIATQRPSVNVITGVIKANIPSRIAFQVASNVDSRTIIDISGAEKLLGKGDMLYYPSSLPKPRRAQGAFVTDKEVERVLEFIKNKNETINVESSFNEEIEKQIKLIDPIEDVDKLFDEAVEFVINENQASISAIQRRFRVGYARAGRIIDQMTRRGIVSEQDGSKPRNVLKNLNEIYTNEDEEINAEDEYSK